MCLSNAELDYKAIGGLWTKADMISIWNAHFEREISSKSISHRWNVQNMIFSAIWFFLKCEVLEPWFVPKILNSKLLHFCYSGCIARHCQHFFAYVKKRTGRDSHALMRQNCSIKLIFCITIWPVRFWI